MAALANRAGVSTATTGTGTITLGAAVTGYQTFADAGVVDGALVSYLIVDGSAWEIGRGTYTATGTTLSRSVLESTNADAAINLSGSAQVFISALAEDFEVAINAQTGTAYTLALIDAGGVVTMDNVSANTLTVPTNASVAFPTGTIISIIQKGSGATTVTGDTGVTINGVSAGSGALSAQYSGVSLVKIDTDEWLMNGDHAAVA